MMEAKLADVAPRLARANENVHVLSTSVGWSSIRHLDRIAMISDGELLEAIINTVPEAHAAVVALLDEKVGK